MDLHSLLTEQVTEKKGIVVVIGDVKNFGLWPLGTLSSALFTGCCPPTPSLCMFLCCQYFGYAALPSLPSTPFSTKRN